MDRLLEELKTLVKEKNLSKAGASRYIRCAPQAISQWFSGARKPTEASRTAIARAILLIRKGELVITDPEFNYNDSLYDRIVLERLKKHLTEKEKAWLMDVDGDYMIYRKRLHGLDEKYKNKKSKT